jgi:hypothetical protein
MSLVKINKKTIISIIILITIISAYFFINNQKLYGNDKESIKQVIKSIEGYENESIEILEMKDFNDERIVGFLSKNNPAYIQFLKNSKGNYEWKHVEKMMDDSFSTFLIHFWKDEIKNVKFMIVTNQENEIAKMQLGVNEHVIEQKFNTNQKSVTWIDLPKANDEGYTFTYKYFDKEGKQIGE